ncbi:AHH domain-containing protein [Myxococcus sp. RHSTA-1-4]|uniref:AHH domain-containing protein n=1 Tax=Myxococcus sp. RHSTA-1-4 TaxID=2874601 RepID=UPI001CBD5F34|nr:AHH domain-containing protein [Myxococcus sp. RHSTA-1-4]
MVADGTLVVSGVAVGTAAGSASGGVGSACTDGSVKKDGYQWHHLATNKNNASEIRGGPWTPRFEDLFARAGMSLEDPANLVYLLGHQGPHPEAYHSEVFKRLEDALGECDAVPRCRPRLVQELQKLMSDVCTPGTRLHQWATHP